MFLSFLLFRVSMTLQRLKQNIACLYLSKLINGKLVNIRAIKSIHLLREMHRVFKMHKLEIELYLIGEIEEKKINTRLFNIIKGDIFHMDAHPTLQTIGLGVVLCKNEN
jgi:hypothetical protein